MIRGWRQLTGAFSVGKYEVINRETSVAGLALQHEPEVRVGLDAHLAGHPLGPSRVQGRSGHKPDLEKDYKTFLWDPQLGKWRALCVAIFVTVRISRERLPSYFLRIKVNVSYYFYQPIEINWMKRTLDTTMTNCTMATTALIKPFAVYQNLEKKTPHPLTFIAYHRDPERFADIIRVY